jgi:RNA polymerase subunit RPABC4/transcription elongation factor Spt4
MKKYKSCKHCKGMGRILRAVCDECGSDEHVGVYEGKDICHNCWAKSLTDEEINNI